MRVEEYTDENGSSPFQEWFDSLEVAAAAKVTTAMLRMERGLVSSIKWFDGIGEYIIDWGPGYRIYLSMDGEELIILFGGGTKKGQNTDIKTAKKLHQQYKDRKQKLKTEEAQKIAQDKKKRKR